MLKKTKFYFVLCILGIFANSGCDVDTGAVSVVNYCEEGDLRCDNSDDRYFISKCIKNDNGYLSWSKESSKDSEKCSGENKCYYDDNSTPYCGECVDGAKKCMENSLVTCSKGKWNENNKIDCQYACQVDRCTECQPENEDICYYDSTGYHHLRCNENGKFEERYSGGECEDSEQKCNGNSCKVINGVARYCENGNYEVCPDNVSCNASGTECGDCKEGTTTCENDEVGYDVVKTCISGTFNINKCSNGSCTVDGDGKYACGWCKNNTSECFDENSAHTCENGTWNAPITCSNGCNAETGKCITESECNDGKECLDGKMCHGGRCVEATCSGDNAKIVNVEDKNVVIDDCAKKNKICVANEGETPSCECDSANNYEDDDKNGCKCADGYVDSDSGCVKKENNCPSNCSNECFNGKCIKCKSGKLYADDDKLKDGEEGVSLSDDGSYGCIDNKPFACHKTNRSPLGSWNFELKSFDNPYGCANDTDIFMCKEGDLKINDENNFCGTKNNNNALFACSDGIVEYILTNSEYNSKYGVCNNGDNSFKFDNQYIYCFDKGKTGRLFEFAVNNIDVSGSTIKKGFLSKSNVDCNDLIKENSSQCPLPPSGYANIESNDGYCFLQKNGSGRYYCKNEFQCEDEPVSLSCPVDMKFTCEGNGSNDRVCFCRSEK